MAQAPIAPWLEGDADAVARAFGMAAQRKALRWMAQGFEAVLEETPAALIGELSNPDEVTVRLPRAGGLAAASCNCKAATCAHRALVALQARRAGGRTHARAAGACAGSRRTAAPGAGAAMADRLGAAGPCRHEPGLPRSGRGTVHRTAPGRPAAPRQRAQPAGTRLA
ncbi:hypothetical protein [Delftia sp.]|uniref:hypothetical protein n=1 Tax=Delftia sp. TaxID=1886637 RepID=UPI00259CC229|nr:hypothetical protein [Delftia sp.]